MAALPSRKSAPPPNSYFLSSDISLPVKIRVGSMHGAAPDSGLSYPALVKARTGVAAADIEVWCQLHSHGRPVGQPERTCNAPGSQLRWNEWLSFSAHYRDLSADASVTLRLVGSSGARATRVVAEASARLFDDDGRSLHTGELKLPLTLLPPPDADGGGRRRRARRRRRRRGGARGGDADG